MSINKETLLPGATISGLRRISTLNAIRQLEILRGVDMPAVFSGLTTVFEARLQGLEVPKENLKPFVEVSEEVFGRTVGIVDFWLRLQDYPPQGKRGLPDSFVNFFTPQELEIWDTTHFSMSERELLRGKQIVWIDEDHEVIAPVVNPLIRKGARVVRYTDASKIPSLDTLEGCDLIILDWFDGGPGLLRGIREAGLKIPVVIHSVSTEGIGEKELKSLGVEAIVIKPVLPRELCSVVEQVLSKQSPTQYP